MRGQSGGGRGVHRTRADRVRGRDAQLRAYRVGPTGDIFRSSDDGEPSGSAGRPILLQIEGHDLANTTIVVDIDPDEEGTLTFSAIETPDHPDVELAETEG